MVFQLLLSDRNVLITERLRWRLDCSPSLYSSNEGAGKANPKLGEKLSWGPIEVIPGYLTLSNGIFSLTGSQSLRIFDTMVYGKW
jgi:hypothetical protein